MIVFELFDSIYHWGIQCYDKKHSWNVVDHPAELGSFIFAHNFPLKKMLQNTKNFTVRSYPVFHHKSIKRDRVKPKHLSPK